MMCPGCNGTGKCNTCEGTAHVSNGAGYYTNGNAGGDWCPRCWDGHPTSTGRCTVCKGSGVAPF